MREPHLSGTRSGAQAILRTGLIAGFVSGIAAGPGSPVGPTQALRPS